MRSAGEVGGAGRRRLTSHPLLGKVPGAVPLISFFTLSGILLWLWANNQEVRQAAERDALRSGGNYVADTLQMFFQHRFDLVRAFGDSVLYEDLERDKRAFEARSLQLQSKAPGYQAVSWIDQSGRIVWPVPFEENKAALGKKPEALPTARDHFRRARLTGQPASTPPIELVQGGYGVATYFPIERDGRRLGYLNVVFRIDELVAHCLKSVDLEIWGVVIRDVTGGARRLLYSSRPEGEVGASYHREIELLERTLEVEVTHALAAGGLATRLDSVILIGGLILAMSASILLRILMALGKHLVASREEAIRLKEVAEYANETKTRFLSNMSHNLRTPLNSLLGTVELLSLAIKEPAYRRLLQNAVRSGDSLRQQVDDVVDLMKIEQGTLTLTPQPTSIVDCVEHAGAIAHEITRHHAEPVHVHIFVSPEIQREVLVDGVRLRRALYELAEAVATWTTEGHIEIVATLEAGASTQTLQVSFTYPGAELTAAQREAISLLHHQEDETVKSERAGSALGLTMAGRLVELMGGALEFTSGPERLSRFTMRLPVEAEVTACPTPMEGWRVVLMEVDAHDRLILARYLSALGAEVSEGEPDEGGSLIVAEHPQPMGAPEGVPIFALQRHTSSSWPKGPIHRGPLYRSLEERFGLGLPVGLLGQEAEPAEVAQKGFSDLRVLVVEDNKVNRVILGAQLKKLGVRSVMAEHGLAGLECYWREHFDLVLMDCNMPVMDGYTCTAEIRRSEADGYKKRVPIVAVTANAFSADLERCLSVGMDDHLSKPVTLEQIRGVIVKWTGIEGDQPRAAQRARTSGMAETI